MAVTYLTEEQLDHMHTTECVGEDYNYIRLFNINMELDGEKLDKEVFCYNSLHGCFYVDGNHIAMKAIKTKRRTFETMDEEQLLTIVKDKLGIDKSLDYFILDNINNEDLRKECSEKIKVMKREFDYRDYEVIEG